MNILNLNKINQSYNPMITVKRTSLLPLLFLFSILIVHACKGNRQDTGSQPNVLIILTDDMGYSDISCFSDEATPTPHIDKLAGEGVRCTDFYVPTPYCAPSRATLLTGRFPLRHGVVQNPAPDAGIDSVGIRDSEVMLGEVFQANGYRTACYGKWHLGHLPQYFPVKHGFDEYFGILYSNDMRPVQLIENMDTVMYPVDQAILTKQYTARAVGFIRKNSDRPFFLHLCHAMPHKPLAASADFYTPETPDDLYNDVIRELDWSVNTILTELKEQRILDRTIVIFMSDNGATYGGNVKPLKGKKATNWEGGMRVPFIIRYPAVFPAGEVVETPCWSPDIYPTLLSLTGIDLPQGVYFDGEDITDIFTGERKTHPPIFTMRGNEVRTVREDNWKLFLERPRFYHEPDLTHWKDKRAPDGVTIIAPVEQATPADYPGIKPVPMEGERFLFNLSDDISEMNNQAGSHPEKVKELEEEFSRFMESLER